MATVASMDVVAIQNWAYVKDPPKDIGPTRHILESYSKIPFGELEDHIRRIREKAWDISRYPCVGRWKFLYILDPLDPRYQQVLFRLSIRDSRDVLLDLGCGLGQVLRQLRSDGVHGSQLIGTDLQSKFIDIGYDLFRDRDFLDATFVTGDMVDPDDQRLDDLHGKVTIIHAGSFFHLFNWVQQLYIGKRLVEFLKPGTRNALIYGRQVGTSKPGDSRTGFRSAYLHDQASFQQLWDEVGAMTRTQWQVQVEPTGESVSRLPDFSSDAHPVNFTIFQIS